VRDGTVKSQCVKGVQVRKVASGSDNSMPRRGGKTVWEHRAKGVAGGLLPGSRAGRDGKERIRKKSEKTGRRLVIRRSWRERASGGAHCRSGRTQAKRGAESAKSFCRCREDDGGLGQGKTGGQTRVSAP